MTDLCVPQALLAGIDGPPSPDDVLGLRLSTGLTQPAAAALCYASLRGYKAWEYGERKMPAGIWALYLIRSWPLLSARQQRAWLRRGQ